MDQVALWHEVLLCAEQEDHTNDWAEKGEKLPTRVILVNKSVSLGYFASNWENTHDQSNINEWTGPLDSQKEKNVRSWDKQNSEEQLYSDWFS